MPLDSGKKNWITIFSLCSRTCLFFKEFVHYASGLEIYSCTKISSPCLWTWKKFLLQFISLCPWTWKVFWKCSLFTMPLDLKNFLEVFFSCYAPRLRIFLCNKFSPCLEFDFFFLLCLYMAECYVCAQLILSYVSYTSYTNSNRLIILDLCVTSHFIEKVGRSYWKSLRQKSSPQMKADQKMLCPKWKQIVSDVSPLIVAQLQLWFYTWKGADAFQQFLGIDLLCPVILVKLL